MTMRDNNQLKKYRKELKEQNHFNLETAKIFAAVQQCKTIDTTSYYIHSASWVKNFLLI